MMVYHSIRVYSFMATIWTQLNIKSKT